MPQTRHLALLLAALLILRGASGAEASRAAEDSRGLPRLLEADGSDLRAFPATVGMLVPQLMVESSWSSYDYPYADPAGNDEFALALTGRRLRFGYFLDGSSHNLVLGGPGGWGVAVGFVDRYLRNESYDYYDDDHFSRHDSEEWERATRLAFGWRRVLACGRLLEMGVAGSLIQGERDVDVYEIRNDDVVTYSLRWKADGGTGLETTLRSLSPAGGLQAAFRFRYEDLHPEEGEPAFDPQVIRRSGTLDLGWRAAVPQLDDFMAGVTVSWWKETGTAFSLYSSELVRIDEDTRYTGAVFISAEKDVTDRLVVRGGLRGPAQFEIEKNRIYKRDGQEYVVADETRRSSGATSTPQIYLGAGYRWKDLIIDAQVNRRIYLDSPFVRWSARLEF